MAETNLNWSGPCFCVVTGASRGIGRALAVEISKHLGPDSVMLLMARKKDDLNETASLCRSDNAKIVCTSIDLGVATEKEMYDVVAQALEGRKVKDFTVGLIFHNVGSIGDLRVDTAHLENVDEMRDYFTLNVFNVIALNTQILKIFAEIEDKLVIVNTSSLCALKPMSGMASYCLGKSARAMYFKVLAEENKTVKVLNYAPGLVETLMIDNAIEETANSKLKDMFTSFKRQGVLLKPETTAKKCIEIVLSGRFESGEQIDYFDEK